MNKLILSLVSSVLVLSMSTYAYAQDGDDDCEEDNEDDCVIAVPVGGAGLPAALGGTTLGTTAALGTLGVVGIALLGAGQDGDDSTTTTTTTGAVD